jgi:hypothetical protein
LQPETVSSEFSLFPFILLKDAKCNRTIFADRNPIQKYSLGKTKWLKDVRFRTFRVFPLDFNPVGGPGYADSPG